MRISILLAMIVLLGGMTVGACGTPGAPQPASSPSVAPGAKSAAQPSPIARVQKVRAAYSETYGGNAVVWVAQESGVFKKHNLDVELNLVPSRTAIEALVASELDVTVGGGAAALAANIQGAELILVAGTVNIYPYKFMVAQSIRSANDLKGQKIGVSRIGSSSDVATRVALQQLNLDPENDVSIVQVGDLASRIAALQSGAIVGAVATPPDNTTLEGMGFHSLLDLSASDRQELNNQVVVRGEFLRSNREAVQDLVNAIIEAIALAKKDKAVTRQTVNRYFNKQVEPQDFEEIYDFFITKVAQREPYPAGEAARAYVESLARRDPAAQGFDVGKVVDNSFVKSAVDSGFVGRLYR